MTQIMIDEQAYTVIISVDPEVMKIYAAEAKQRGLSSGIALIQALVADWQAILEPVQPKQEPMPVIFSPNEYSLDNPPFGGSY